MNEHTSWQRWHMPGRNPFAALALHRTWRRRIRPTTSTERRAA